MDNPMTPPGEEAQAEREGSGRPVEDRIREGILHAISRWGEEHIYGEPNVAEAKMAAYNRIHSAMRDGWRKDFHAWMQPMAELDAHMTQWTDTAKSGVLRVVQTVVGAENPLVLLIPATLPGHIDALSATASGWMGENVVKFQNWEEDMLHGAMDAGRRGIDAIYQGIVTAFRPPEAPLSQPLTPQPGGAA